MERTKTMSIKVALEDLETGLIDDEGLSAIEAEKLRVKEEIEGIRKAYREGLISCDMMETRIDSARRYIRKLLEDLKLIQDDDNS